MTYQEFKDYLITYLWKAGDAVLIANLDNLIKQGEATLNRELREEQRHAVESASITTQTHTLPADYHSLRMVVDTSANLGEFQYVSPGELKARRDRSTSSNWWPFYSIRDNSLLLCGPAAVSEPLLLDIHYTRKIPRFQTADASWLTEDNLDLLTYATLFHTASFLREDERTQIWAGQYKDIINTMNEASAHEKQRGVYGAMPLPRDASGKSRRGVRTRTSNKLHT